MPGSVLIIDADEEFAGRLKSTLEAHGAEVHTTGDGRQGLDMARAQTPTAIVVCVELPRMSGYSICAKLKKDANLKSVTLVITSAEATQETFEHHKKLKNRAEEYLRKPFEPDTLVGLLRPYMELSEAPLAVPAEALSIEPEPPAVIDDADAFSADDQFHFDDVPDIDIDASVSVEAGVPMAEGVAHPEALAEGAYEEDEVMTTVGIVPSAGNEVLFKEIEQLRSELEAEREAHAQTVRDRDEAIENERAATSQLQALSSAPPSQISASRDLLSIKKELHDRDKQLLELKDEAQQKERELLSQRDREMEFESRLVQTQEEFEELQRRRSELDEEVASLQQRLAEQQQTSAEEAAKAEAAAEELRGEIGQLQGELETRQQTITSQEEDITSLRASNEELTAEVTRLGNEVSAVLAESSTLRDQLAASQVQNNELENELEVSRETLENTRNALEATQASLVETEEQAGRAFERIRRDGETKTKVRQALDIALRLLTEPEEAPPVEDGAPAAAEEVHP